MAVPERTMSERPLCGSGQQEEYNTGLQIMGLFLILSLSSFGCSFPLLVRLFPRIPVPRYALFVCRHFGTGIILATSLIHLVPTAFTNLLNPCLPPFWTDTFPAMGGLVMMLGVLAIVSIEMFFTSRNLGHTHQSDLVNPQNPKDGEASSEDSGLRMRGQGAHAHDAEQQANESGKTDNRRLLLQYGLLEAGILFHSIFIGMAIAFSRGTSFVVLLIAISFHQVFEGLALGSRIAEIDMWKPTSPKPWLMALAYGVTAPSGQAVGLAIHGMFDLQSQTGLITVGITNAFSSGLLIYAGLVQLFYQDFLSERSLHGKSALVGRRRIGACIAFLAGVIAMTLVGIWA